MHPLGGGRQSLCSHGALARARACARGAGLGCRRAGALARPPGRAGRAPNALAGASPRDVAPRTLLTQVLVWRMFLGWDHVGSRLQAAVVEYEESERRGAPWGSRREPSARACGRLLACRASRGGAGGRGGGGSARRAAPRRVRQPRAGSKQPAAAHTRRARPLPRASPPTRAAGWYDGQKWVKTPEVLARDRLAVAYEIRPAVARLKSTLLGLGGGWWG